MPTPDRPHEVDALDAGIVELFAAEPRVGVLECSRRLGVARGTVQARLDRMVRDGAIRGWGPEVDPAAMGYVVTAFVTLEIRQHHPEPARALQDSDPRLGGEDLDDPGVQRVDLVRAVGSGHHAHLAARVGTRTGHIVQPGSQTLRTVSPLHHAPWA